MISIAGSHSRSARLSRSNAVLVLEPPRHARKPPIFLTPGKHLIGSSESCSVRLLAEGVQPRHAMILVGENQILLKALVENTWVNDSPTSETAIRPGDRISIGPITYQVRFATSDELASHDWTADATAADEPAGFAEVAEIDVTAAIEEEADQIICAPPLESPLVDVTKPELLPETAESVTRGGSKHQSITVEQPHEPSKPAIAFKEIRRQIDSIEDQSRTSDVPKPLGRRPEDDRLAAREQELNQLAEELSRQSQRLRERNAQLAERELELERKQAQLVLDNDRLAATAQSTRRALADEHTRQMTLWEEWDAAYRRSSEDLKSQLNIVEERRAAIQAENEKLANERAEIQRLQADFERERRASAAERVQASAELGELHTLRAAFETERRTHLVEVQEREAQLASERRALAAAQDELLAARQQIEHDRTSFATERSSESLLREKEIREQTLARIRLNDDESELQVARLELDSARRSLEEQKSEFIREKEQFEIARLEMDELRQRLASAENELSVVAQSRQEEESRLVTYESDWARRKQELDEWQQTLESQKAELDEIRQTIRDEQQQIAVARDELRSVVDHRTVPNRDFVAYDSGPNLEPGLPEFTHRHSTSEPSGNLRTNRDHLISLEQLHPDAEVWPTAAAPSSPQMSAAADHFGTRESLAFNGLDDMSDRPLSEVQTYRQTSGDDLPTPFGLPSEELEVATASTVAVVDPIEVVRKTLELENVVQPESNVAADQTMTEVNQRFGFVSDLLDDCLSGGQLPRSRAETSGSKQLIEPDANDEYPGSSSSESGTTLNRFDGLQSGARPSLRSQLAQMFQLEEGEVAARSADHQDEEPAFEKAVEPYSLMGSQSDSHVEMLTENVREESTEIPLSSAEGIQAEVGRVDAELADSPAVEAASVLAPADEDPWTRRLRELSQLVETKTPVAFNPPEPEAIVVEKQPPVAEVSEVDVSTAPAPEPAAEADDDEYSVEAQLARLLGRPRRSVAAQPREQVDSETKDVPVPSIKKVESTKSDAGQAAVTDRSHLAAEPKHKQNSQTVRDEVQSFRAVAQMSARTALAKHSWNNLKSQFYFTGMLTVAAAGATAWYLGTFLYGTEKDSWKGIICSMATIACCQRLVSSYAKLNQWRRQNSKSSVMMAADKPKKVAK